MNKKRFAAIIAMAGALLCAACGNSPGKSAEAAAPEAGSYKSIIRLWQKHHMDSVLTRQLAEALRKYPDMCQEVWFCTPEGKFDMESNREHARLMGRAAETFRKAGIKPSIQSIVLGHPEHNIDRSKPKPFDWSSIMSIGGQEGYTQSCPRQPAYLERISDIQALYAEAVQPHAYMIDDDLRITEHAPAGSICFCDTCLAQFNAQHGYSFTRETLAGALVGNAEGGQVRSRWISFSKESLAGVARAIARKVHAVSPHTQMGLQHVAFHNYLLEGYDWNKIFDAMEEETGITPASRPGHGFYNDHAPRGMLDKAFGIARQIRRLNENIVDISPEIEGWRHKATGKSPQGICTETLLYLALGGTQMSYAIVCSGQESVEWYAETYFKFLNRYQRNFREFTAFNCGTQPGGLDAYISPDHVLRDVKPGENPWAWSTTGATAAIASVATLGLPFSPDGDYTCATYMDAASLAGISNGEMKEILRTRNLFVDKHTWKCLREQFPHEKFKTIEVPEELRPVKATGNGADYSALTPKMMPECYQSEGGRRIAVVPSFSTDIDNTQRLHLLRVADWASEGRLPVFMVTPAQGAVVPRVRPDGMLHSVTYLNCTISEQDNVVLKLRGTPHGAKTKATWKMADKRDVVLDTKWEEDELIVTLPPVPGWHIGWLALE